MLANVLEHTQLEHSSDPESLSEAVLFAEAELASEAARPNPQGVESEAGVVSLN